MLPDNGLPRRNGPSDREVQKLLEQSRAAGAEPIHRLTPEQARERVAGMRAVLPPGPDVHKVEDLLISGPGGPVPVRVYRPEAHARGAAVYFHGGGWVVGGIDESDALSRTIATASGCNVVSVGYRLAPEHRFPAAVEDADAAVLWAEGAFDPGTKLAVIGDSSGGNLAAVTARHARDRGSSAIALQVLVYPVTHHLMVGASYRENATGYMVTTEDVGWFWSQYAPDVEMRASPDASPLDADDLTRLPPALVLTAEYDPVRDDGFEYAERLRNAGVHVEVKHYPSMVHGFFPLLGLLSTASDAVAMVGEAIAGACTGDAR